jgi:hypothetical protein
MPNSFPSIIQFAIILTRSCTKEFATASLLIGRFSPSYAENSMPAHAGTYGLFEGVASMSQALTESKFV